MKKTIMKVIAVIAGAVGITAIIYCLTEKVPKCLDPGGQVPANDDDGWDDEEEDHDIAGEYEKAMDTSSPEEA